MCVCVNVCIITKGDPARIRTNKPTKRISVNVVKEREIRDMDNVLDLVKEREVEDIDRDPSSSQNNDVKA